MDKIYVLVEEREMITEDRFTDNISASSDRDKLALLMDSLIEKDEYGIIERFNATDREGDMFSDLSYNYGDYFMVELDCDGWLNYYIQQIPVI